MIDDLKIIKKQFGEVMAHFCREEFPTILEQPRALSHILLGNFNPTRFLYQDICEQDKVDEFKDYIYNIFYDAIQGLKEDKEIPTPEELLAKAGYTLYECKTTEDIESFRKFYAKGEELCTFRSNRLEKCYVFFAVKNNVAEIRRENFSQPKREDEYGTSVISIQFSRNESHFLSIKNRYNHKVPHPDATFSNNLDNIIEGLTASFAIHYGLAEQFVNKFHLDGYILANDGKYYKYNYELNTIYYCPDNIIIANGEVSSFAKEKFIVMDYFVLNLVTKEIYVYDDNDIFDSFPSSIGEIKKIFIQKEGPNKRIIITPKEGEDITILLDSMNCIIEYQNSNITNIPDDFLKNATYIQKIEVLNTEKIGDSFCSTAFNIAEIILPKTKEIGNDFLSFNRTLKKIFIPECVVIGSDFCYCNNELEELYCPCLEVVGNRFAFNNYFLKKFYAPKLKSVGIEFCYNNRCMAEIVFPSLENIGKDFFNENLLVKVLIAPGISIDNCYLLCRFVFDEVSEKTNNTIVRVRKKDEYL